MGYLCKTNTFLALVVIILVLLINFCNGLTMYNVESFGAKSDGKSDSTKAFLSAWAKACALKEAATIYVPSGRFFIGRSANFDGRFCKSSDITFRIDGTLVAPSNFNVVGSSGYWLKFGRVNGISIFGGTLDGQGTSLWTCKNSANNCPQGAIVSLKSYIHLIRFCYHLPSFFLNYASRYIF